jgi:hypothetical protein
MIKVTLKRYPKRLSRAKRKALRQHDLQCAKIAQALFNSKAFQDEVTTKMSEMLKDHLVYGGPRPQGVIWE